MRCASGSPCGLRPHSARVSATRACMRSPRACRRRARWSGARACGWACRASRSLDCARCSATARASALRRRRSSRALSSPRARSRTRRTGRCLRCSCSRTGGRSPTLRPLCASSCSTPSARRSAPRGRCRSHGVSSARCPRATTDSSTRRRSRTRSPSGRRAPTCRATRSSRSPSTPPSAWSACRSRCTLPRRARGTCARCRSRSGWRSIGPCCSAARTRSSCSARAGRTRSSRSARATTTASSEPPARVRVGGLVRHVFCREVSEPRGKRSVSRRPS
mmetsp:Transcript_16927/g.52595  ORF Transcript_16927/g.52595 Transcript_16927/m.52595 type:complete len:278 (+) Transcript_16927:134-967(+)